MMRAAILAMMLADCAHVAPRTLVISFVPHSCQDRDSYTRCEVQKVERVDAIHGCPVVAGYPGHTDLCVPLPEDLP